MSELKRIFVTKPNDSEWNVLKLDTFASWFDRLGCKDHDLFKSVSERWNSKRAPSSAIAEPSRPSTFYRLCSKFFFCDLSTSSTSDTLAAKSDIQLYFDAIISWSEVQISSHSMLRGVRIGEASHPGPRLRRRGPRSFAAREARRQRRAETKALFEPGTTVEDRSEKGLTMFHLNLRGYLSHIAEVTALLRGFAEKPMLVSLNETFLTRAAEHVELEGYGLLARRDRGNQWGGGVLVFVLTEYLPRVTLVEKSAVAERIWAIVHADRGPYLVCCWYRPPAPGDIESISTFEAEYKKHRDGVLGTFVLGDLNVHSVRWLYHSAGESVEGRCLAEAAKRLGLRQLVREPTRGKYLLDIALTDVADCSARPTSAVADHRGVLTTVKFKVPQVAVHTREAWSFRDADWERLGSDIENADWNFLESTNPSDGARMLTDQLLSLAETSIPKRTIAVRKSSHPWLTERGEEAVRQKHAAQGTDREAEAARECSEILMEEQRVFIRKMRGELADAKSSSKSWWSKARRLMDQRQRVSSIPALKKGETWVMDTVEKADLFCDTFAKKNIMIPEEPNEYSEITAMHEQDDHFTVPTKDCTFDILKGLDEDSALGPDLVPTRILKKCAEALAPIVHRLILSILCHGSWPMMWMVHWLVPLHKRNSVYNPSNYRGIHLTAQLSKVCERVLATSFVPRLISIGAFGTNQFAYMPARGARDALAYLVLKWIHFFGIGKKIALYCSDVAGAFDKVKAKRLLEKLQAWGVPELVLRVLRSWLARREARVAVGGKFSRGVAIENMVYQGTVFGPPLWNIFYEDASLPIQKNEFEEIVFADDLNAFKDFEKSEPDANLYGHMQECQSDLHRWGRANQVSFDPSKESMHVLALRGGQGANFRLLGIPFDHGLLMHDAIHEIVGEASWKMGSILRTQRYFNDAELVNLYKSKLLSYLEYRTSAIYHSCETALRPLDSFQDKFLSELAISPEDALFHFNLAPLRCRRDMAMLGIIHRCVLGRGPSHFKEFFKLDSRPRRHTRRIRHDFQLEDIRNRNFLEIERRSALGLIWVYNHLPERIVVEQSVKTFQSKLQGLLKEGIKSGCEDWRDILSPRVPVYRHPLR